MKHPAAAPVALMVTLVATGAALIHLANRLNRGITS